MFDVYKNVVSDTQYWVIWKTLRKANWKLLGYSANESQAPLWFKDLAHDPFWTQSFLKLINEKCGRNFELHRIYANGQMAGQNGSLHFDDNRPNAYTFLFYVNPNWHPEWGGATVFADEETRQIQSYIPEANTGVLFRGAVNHVGLEPTSSFKDLRITVAAKLLEKE